MDELFARWPESQVKPYTVWAEYHLEGKPAAALRVLSAADTARARSAMLDPNGGVLDASAVKACK